MNFLKDLLRPLGRHVTVLIVPHTDLPLWRFRFTLNFIIFCLLLWTGLTLSGGYLLGRHVDYWITKADNRVMRTRIAFLASEIDRSRENLDRARETDQQMRTLLGMRDRRAIIEVQEGAGGPNVMDRRSLRDYFLRDPVRSNPAVIRSNIVGLRKESEKRLASFQEIRWYINARRSLYRSTPVGWPAEGRLTSRFGYRFSPINRGDDSESSEFHSGLDIASNADTPILATADGIVRHAGWRGGYGRMVLLEHEWGYSTLYGHTSKVLVRLGQTIRRGEMIAYMGTTGRSTGDHLHYEIWRHGKPVNPLRYLKSGHEDDSLIR